MRCPGPERVSGVVTAAVEGGWKLVPTHIQDTQVTEWLRVDDELMSTPSLPTRYDLTDRVMFFMRAPAYLHGSNALFVIAFNTPRVEELVRQFRFVTNL